LPDVLSKNPDFEGLKQLNEIEYEYSTSVLLPHKGLE
jgi:hypothetical protein